MRNLPIATDDGHAGWSLFQTTWVASMCAAPSSSPAHWACLRPSMNATPAGWLQHSCVVYTFDWRGMAAVSAAKPGRLQGQGWWTGRVTMRLP